MTDEITPKKPRRKRRTKAQIEAEKVKEVEAPKVEEKVELSAYQLAKMNARKGGTPVTYSNPNGEEIANRFKRRRAERRSQ